MENKIRQDEELEALKLIYGENAIEYREIEDDGVVSRRLDMDLGNGGDKNNNSNILLRIFLSPTYPSGTDMPIFELRNVNWQNFDQSKVYEDLCDIHKQQAGEVVLFQWIEYIKEELIDGIADSLPDVDTRNDDEDDIECSVTQDHNSYKKKGEEEEGSYRLLEGIEVIHGQPFTDRKSTFQAHVARIKTEQEALHVLEWLKMDRKIARATHNMWAFRVWDVIKQAQVNDNDDDGEMAAGGKMAELLSIMNVKNVMVVVSRWFGGILLGPDRFRIINNVARQLLEETGFTDRLHASSSSGKQSGKKR